MGKRFQDFTTKSDKELRDELTSVQRALFGLRVGLANQAVTDKSGMVTLRRDIARIKTLLRQRQLQAAAPPAVATTTVAPPATAPVEEPAKT